MRHPLRDVARSLRRRAAVNEVALWRLLRNRRLDGLKFRRQVPVGPFVLDFVALGPGLVIEADGPFHDPGRDAARDRWLTARGFRVLRFSNAEIANHPERVLDAIARAAGRTPRLAGPLRNPSPLEGEGGGRRPTDEGI